MQKFTVAGDPGWKIAGERKANEKTRKAAAEMKAAIQSPRLTALRAVDWLTRPRNYRRGAFALSVGEERAV
jgi:hypothetical protein